MGRSKDRSFNNKTPHSVFYIYYLFSLFIYLCVLLRILKIFVFLNILDLWSRDHDHKILKNTYIY